MTILTMLWNGLRIIFLSRWIQQSSFSIPVTQSRHCCAVSVKFHNRFSWQSFQMETMHPFVVILSTRLYLSSLRQRIGIGKIHKETHRPKWKQNIFSANTIQMANETQCRHKFDLTDASINRNCCQFISSFTVCICYILGQKIFAQPNVPKYRNCERWAAHKYSDSCAHSLSFSHAHIHRDTQQKINKRVGARFVSIVQRENCVMKVRNFCRSENKITTSKVK